MNSGRLDRQITIERNAGTRDAYGQVSESWGTYKTLWAQKIEAKGTEAQIDAQQQGERPVTFRVRYRDDLLTSDRLVYNSDSYDILNFVEIGRRHMLDIICTKYGDSVS